MSWIPIPPVSTNDNATPPVSSNPSNPPNPSHPSYPYPPIMSVPPPMFGTHPGASQTHYPLKIGPKEVIFPPGKTTNLQTILDKCSNLLLLGLEYIIEIRHVAGDKRGPWYSCRLCDVIFQSRDGSASCIDSMRHHITLASHKLNYLEKHFKNVKEQKLEPPKNLCTLEGIDKIVEKIERHYGRLKVKLVIGQNIYFSSLTTIDKLVNDGQHFEEDEHFLDFLLKKKKSIDKGKSKIYNSPEKISRSESRDSRKSSTQHSIKKNEETPTKDENTSRRKSSGKRRSKSITKETSAVRRRSGLKSPSRSRESRKNENRNRLYLSESSENKRKHSRSRSRSTTKYRMKDINKSGSRSRSKEQSHLGNKSKTIKSSKDRYYENKKISRSRSASRNVNKTQARMRSRTKSGGQKSSISPVLDKHYSQIGEKPKTRKKGEIILSFLEEEVIMLKEMENEKTLYYDTPSKHPLYESEWGKFWKKKYEELKNKGMSINGYNLTPEWIVEWRNFYDSEHSKKITEEREKLLRKWNLEVKDIEWFNSQEKPEKKKSAPEVISLTDSDEDEDNVRSTSPWEARSPPPPIVSRPSTSKMTLKIPKTEIKRQGHKLASNDFTSKLRVEDVSILDTLNFLSALEGTSLLGNLGSKVQQTRDTALGLENDEYGSSQLLVDQNECYNLMDQAREMIQHKIASGLVPDKQKSVCRMTIDNITILLQQSTCQKNEILEIDTSTPDKGDPRLVKLTIADTISRELAISGTKLSSQEEFNALVEAEYVRVKHHLPNKSRNQNLLSNSLETTFNISTQNTHSMENVHPVSTDQPLFSAYSMPNTSHHLPAPRPGPGSGRGLGPNLGPGLRPEPVQNPPMIDWNSLINIMSTVNKNTEEGKSTLVEPIGNAVKTEVNPYDVLTEDEIVQLVKNFQQLDEAERKDLIVYMKKLETLNPEKVKRMKRKMYSK